MELTDAVPEVVPDDPEPDVTLAEFFPPAFMAEHTEFDSFAEFRAESPWAFTDRDDLDRISTDELDRYVDRTTEFDSWHRMRNRAAEREIYGRLLV